MNKVVLSGRLTRDPEVRYTPTGKCVATFSIAVDRFRTADGKKEADFVPIVVWGKTAEYCGNYLAKGLKILLDGRLQIRSYEAKDGQKRWVTEVIADSIEQLEYKKTDSTATKDTGYQSDDLGSFGVDISGDDEIPF